MHPHAHPRPITRPHASAHAQERTPHAQSALFACFTLLLNLKRGCAVKQPSLFPTAFHFLEPGQPKAQFVSCVMLNVMFNVVLWHVPSFFQQVTCVSCAPDNEGWLPAPSFQGRGGVSGGGVRGRGVPRVPLGRRPQGVPAVSPDHRVFYRLSSTVCLTPDPFQTREHVSDELIKSRTEMMLPITPHSPFRKT